MRALPLASLLLAACSDYGLEEQKEDVALDPPVLAANPERVALTGLCAAAGEEITLSNAGESPLELSAIAVEGEGWVITSAPSLPLVLKAGESTVVSVEGSGGEADLVVLSTDPAQPELRLPLLAVANQPPLVSILSPTSGEIFAEGADTNLSGTVADPDQAAETLSATWSASVDGPLATGAPLADGSTEHNWPAAARTAGPQTVSLTATDACGAEATARTEVCQDGANSYAALALADWHYEGSAAWDSTSDNLLLTPATADQVGSAFELSTPVNADSVDIDFYVYISGGSGADGLSLTALDVGRATSFLGGTGCGIGYGGDASCTAGPALPGWSLEIDTYYNAEADPTGEDHLAFTFDGDVDGYSAWAPLPEMEDGNWHFVQVSVLAPRVTVAIDGTTYIDQDIPGNYAFSAYVGFTAGTGSLTNEHRIDELVVTDYACD